LINVFVFAASRSEALKNYEKTIENPLEDHLIMEFLGEDFLWKLRREYPDGPIYAWGATPKKNNIRVWKAMRVGDYVIAYGNKMFKKLLRIIGKAHNPNFARYLWGEGRSPDNKGFTWEYMYFMQLVTDINRRSPIIFRGHTGPIKKSELRMEIEKIIRDVTGKSLNQIDKEIRKENLNKRIQKILGVRKIKRPKRIIKVIHEVLERIEKGNYYVPDTWSRHKVRVGQSVLRLIVLEMYGRKCCICGLDIPELLEIAHVKSWAEDPKNRLNPRNCLLLCPLHHKALDKGFIEIKEGRVICTEKVRRYSSDSVKTLLLKYDNAPIMKPEMDYNEALKKVREMLGV